MNTAIKELFEEAFEMIKDYMACSEDERKIYLVFLHRVCEALKETKTEEEFYEKFKEIYFSVLLDVLKEFYNAPQQKYVN